MAKIGLVELSSKIADPQQPLREKVLTIIYALQVEAGGGPITASEIQYVMELGEFSMGLSMIEAMLENLQVTGLIEEGK